MRLKCRLLINVFIQNAYISGQGCTSNVHQGGIAYIGNPGPIAKGPYLALANGRSVFRRCASVVFPFLSLIMLIPCNCLLIFSSLVRELDNGFLLHRVSSLEIVSVSWFLQLVINYWVCGEIWGPLDNNWVPISQQCFLQFNKAIFHYHLWW